MKMSARPSSPGLYTPSPATRLIVGPNALHEAHDLMMCSQYAEMAAFQRRNSWVFLCLALRGTTFSRNSINFLAGAWRSK